MTKLARVLSPDADKGARYWEEWVQDALGVMRSLQNVRHLHLRCRHKDVVSFQTEREGVRFSSPLLRAGWTAYASNLRSLELSIPWEGIHDILVLDGKPLHLPALENLKLFLTTDDLRFTIPPASLATLRTLIIPFINAHSQTLRSLSIQSSNQLPLNGCFNDIFLPNLQSISIPIYFVGNASSTASTGHRQVLHAHKQHLKYLSLSIFSAVNGFLEHDAFGGIAPDVYPAIPSLQTLKLSVCLFAGTGRLPTPLLLVPVKQYHTSLQTLIIGIELFHVEFRDILRIFPTPSPLLTKFEFRIRNLSCRLFRTLSCKFPNLYEMAIVFDAMVAPEEEEKVIIMFLISAPLTSIRPHFSQPTVCDGWSLRHLRLQIPRSVLPAQHNDQRGHISGVVGLLPDLYTLNDKPTSSFGPLALACA